MRRAWLLVPLCFLLVGCTKKLGDACTATTQCDRGLTCCGTCVDAQKDVNHCGSCTQACGTQNAGAICQAGACRLACLVGFGDCNQSPSDGCEAELAVSVSSCGSCGVVCSSSNAAGVCRAAHCALGACNQGFADCDLQAGNGCEVDTRSSAQHCGGCGQPCVVPHATPRCTNSSCEVALCDTGFGDCDLTTPGCETDLLHSPQHCGTCTNPCGNGLSCVMGECKAQGLVLFGGFTDTQDSTASAEVWRFDVTAKAFTRVTTAAPAGSPPARGYHAAVWDRTGNRMLVFGGYDGTGAVANDVWALDFAVDPPAWGKVTATGTAPTPRIGMAAGWDAATRKWFLFGGTESLSTQVPLADLFVFDAAANAWSHPAAAGPGARFLAAGTWDAASARFIVFGGAQSSSVSLDDTWAFDPAGGAWQQVPATGPPARFAAAFFPGTLITFGGFNLIGGSTPVFYDDVWSLALSPIAWHDEGSMSGPAPRAMQAPSTLAGVDYLFGGLAIDASTFNPITFDDVWSYVPSTKAWTTLRANGAPNGPPVNHAATFVAPE